MDMVVCHEIPRLELGHGAEVHRSRATEDQSENTATSQSWFKKSGAHKQEFLPPSPLLLFFPGNISVLCPVYKLSFSRETKQYIFQFNFMNLSLSLLTSH